MYKRDARAMMLSCQSVAFFCRFRCLWCCRRHPKSGFALVQTSSLLNFIGLYPNSQKEKEIVFVHRVLRKTWNYEVSRYSWSKEMYKKSVMHVRSCCFAKLNLLLLLFFSTLTSWLLHKLPINSQVRPV